MKVEDWEEVSAKVRSDLIHLQHLEAEVNRLKKFEEANSRLQKANSRLKKYNGELQQALNVAQAGSSGQNHSAIRIPDHADRDDADADGNPRIIQRTPKNVRKLLQAEADGMKERFVMAQNICAYKMRNGSFDNFEEEVFLQAAELRKIEQERKLFAKEVLYWMAVEKKKVGSVLAMQCSICKPKPVFGTRQTFLNHFTKQHSLPKNANQDGLEEYRCLTDKKVFKKSEVLIYTGLLKSEQSFALPRKAVPLPNLNAARIQAVFERVDRPGEKRLLKFPKVKPLDTRAASNRPPPRKLRRND